MKLLAFAVYDLKVQAFDQPFFARTRAEVVRWFGDLANSDKGRIGAHPEDYALYFIGEFDAGTGQFTNAKHESLALASSLVKVLPGPEVMRREA